MIKPLIRNLICPFCKLAWLCSIDARTYICPHCGVVLFARQLIGQHSQYE